MSRTSTNHVVNVVKVCGKYQSVVEVEHSQDLLTNWNANMTKLHSLCIYLFSIKLRQHVALSPTCEGRDEDVDDTVHVMEGEHVENAVIVTPLPRLQHALHLGGHVAKRRHHALWVEICVLTSR